MATITPFLWFDDNLEEAIDYYCTVFKDAKKGVIRRGPDGKAFGGNFELQGQKFMALNGGPTHAHFTEAISFFVNVGGQDEVDELWNKLTADGGEPGQCGWLKDKFGLSWQIVPEALGRCLSNPDPAKAQKAMQAMQQMQKIIVADLEAAVA